MTSTQIGVDLGGTKIEAAALDSTGEYRAKHRAGTPNHYSDIIRTVLETVHQVEKEVGRVPRLGVGVPGSASPRTGLIRNSNVVALNGRSLEADLCQAAGRPVRVANDANCLALSEAADGSATDGRVVFAVVLGTGCGGGVVVDGKIVGGANGLGGELGHNSLPWQTNDEIPGPLCWCGQRGCVETWVSGTGFQRSYAEAAGNQLSAKQIIAAMRAGEAVATEAFEAWLSRLARALASIVNVLDPDVFVFGGGMANVAEIYSLLPPLMRKHIFSDHWSGRLTPAKWGDASGVRGAARLWDGEAER